MKTKSSRRVLLSGNVTPRPTSVVSLQCDCRSPIAVPWIGSPSWPRSQRPSSPRQPGLGRRRAGRPGRNPGPTALTPTRRTQTTTALSLPGAERSRHQAAGQGHRRGGLELVVKCSPLNPDTDFDGLEEVSAGAERELHQRRPGRGPQRQPHSGAARRGLLPALAQLGLDLGIYTVEAVVRTFPGEARNDNNLETIALEVR